MINKESSKGLVMESLMKNGSQRELVTLSVLLGYELANAYANFYDLLKDSITRPIPASLKMGFNPNRQ